jgi:hypothetical protein
MDSFIDAFNKSIETDGKFSLNTVLHNIPQLTPEEFTKVQNQAEKNGYQLTKFPDEHNTTTYKLTPIGE